MTGFDFPVIDLTATGANIRRLRMSQNLSVRQVQDYFGFAEPRVIYKWQKGECLPTVDNLFALSKLFKVPMDQILVQVTVNRGTNKEQQAAACCSGFLNHFIAKLKFINVPSARDGGYARCARGISI